MYILDYNNWQQESKVIFLYFNLILTCQLAGIVFCSYQ